MKYRCKLHVNFSIWRRARALTFGRGADRNQQHLALIKSALSSTPTNALGRRAAGKVLPVVLHEHAAVQTFTERVRKRAPSRSTRYT